MPAAGALRRRVIIEDAVAVRNDIGEEIEDWTAIGARWAAVEPLQGREYVESQQTQASADHRITFRYDSLTSQLTPKQRLRVGEQIFDIESPPLNLQGRNVAIQVMAKVLV
jgi:SPP1 family predicted phage head-tail adaptor